MSKALLYDSTLCIGCKQCEQACATQNGLAYDDRIAAEEYQSAHKLTCIVNRGDKFMRRLCMSCNDPSCASVCPVGALVKTRLGPVTYDPSKCMGCRYCMVACPFSVPKYEWGKLFPKVEKCTMCPDRLAQGKQTACAAICPTGATKFGERDELIAEARQRLHDHPGQYVDHIYGLAEVGGTSVLLLSAVPFETFGYRSDISPDPLPLLTYRVLSQIPDFVALGGMALGGVWWITHRREQVALREDPGANARNSGGKR
jgi:formate dehydrogenase iron-sulfur subunit